MPSLILTVEGCDRHHYPLGKATVLIGRKEDADIQLPSEIVSGNHASIILENNEFVLHDNGSENGSFVNGKQVSRHVLHHLDLVRFGEYLFLVDMQDAVTTRKQVYPRRREVNVEPPKHKLPSNVPVRRSSQRIALRTSNRISLKLSKPVVPKQDPGTLSKTMLDSL